ncbi:MAG: hypothetical protein Q9178_004508 [Gyalolechia marmorata]
MVKTRQRPYPPKPVEVKDTEDPWTVKCSNLGGGKFKFLLLDRDAPSSIADDSPVLQINTEAVDETSPPSFVGKVYQAGGPIQLIFEVEGDLTYERTGEEVVMESVFGIVPQSGRGQFYGISGGGKIVIYMFDYSEGEGTCVFERTNKVGKCLQ